MTDAKVLARRLSGLAPSMTLAEYELALTAALEQDRREMVEASIEAAIAAGKRGETALGMLDAIRSLSPKGTPAATKEVTHG